jgi:hypothetical protein
MKLTFRRISGSLSVYTLNGNHYVAMVLADQILIAYGVDGSLGVLAEYQHLSQEPELTDQYRCLVPVESLGKIFAECLLWDGFDDVLTFLENNKNDSDEENTIADVTTTNIELIKKGILL